MKTSPKERRHKRTRAAILRTAREIITEDGVEALSMRKIADRIDYSPAGLYEYFSSKEEIVAHVCIENERRLAAYLSAVKDNLDPGDHLVELGLAYLRFAKENRDHFMLQFTFRPEGGDYSESTVPRESSFGILVSAVQALIDAGRIPNAPSTETVAYTTWAYVHGMAMLQLTALRDTNQDFGPADRWGLIRYVEGLASG